MYNIEKIDDIRDTLVTIGTSVGCEVAIHKLIPTNNLSTGKKIGIELVTALACTGAVKVGKIVSDYISEKLIDSKEIEKED